MKISTKLFMLSLLPLGLYLIGTAISAFQISLSNDATSQYISSYVDRNILVLKIYEEIGYGKGIHAFKNYVLRQNEAYRVEAEKDFQNAIGLIQDYLNFKPLSEVEIDAMATLLVTINEYKSKVPIAQKLIASGASIRAVDAAVRVDDSPAVSSLDKLQKYFSDQRDKHLMRLERAQERVFGVTLFTFLVAIALALYSSRRLSMKMVSTIQKILSLSRSIGSGDLKDLRKYKVELKTQDELEALRGQIINLGIQLDQLFHKISVKNKDLEDFAHIASHDLKEPIKKISALTDFIELDFSEKIDEEGMGYIKQIKALSARMIDMTNELLRYSLISEEEIQWEEVDLNEVLRNSLENLSVSIKESQTLVEVGELPKVKGNKVLLVLLFQNLISNSIKFRNTSLRNKITVNALRNENCWELTIMDNGIGFDAKYSRSIFRPFHRLHRQSHYSGTGIGLATCQKIAEFHGAQITATSSPGEGSQFSFSLEVYEQAQPIRKSQ